MQLTDAQKNKVYLLEAAKNCLEQASSFIHQALGDCDVAHDYSMEIGAMTMELDDDIEDVKNPAIDR